jgi:membrane-associated phospholipid phosphatase
MADARSSGMPRRRRPEWMRDVEQVDLAIYGAIATTPTPALDGVMRRLTRAADGSRLWLAAAAGMSLQGARGRRAAAMGLASIGVTSAVVNVVVKPIARRRRPDRASLGVPPERHVAMPTTRSFPSGHAASAFAFASGVGSVQPDHSLPLHLLAAAVAYSRVHTGVHFPGDAVLGATLGTVLSQVTTHALRRR